MLKFEDVTTKVKPSYSPDKLLLKGKNNCAALRPPVIGFPMQIRTAVLAYPIGYTLTFLNFITCQITTGAPMSEVIAFSGRA